MRRIGHHARVQRLTVGLYIPVHEYIGLLTSAASGASDRSNAWLIWNAYVKMSYRPMIWLVKCGRAKDNISGVADRRLSYK